MLAWLIVISVFCVILVIAYYHVIKELNDYCTKTDRLLDFDPFIDYNNPYHGKRLKSDNPYDSTPVFIMGIKSIVEEMDRYTRRPTIRYNSKVDYTTFKNLESRVDNIADSVGGMDNRIDELENDLAILTKRVKDAEDVLKEGKVD